MNPPSQPAFIRRRELILAAGLACASVPALAQTAGAFPAKPVRLVVPFPAGGGTDTMARALADSLSKMWGQSVIVDNKAGAGTVVGNDFVSKSAPDGLTLLLNTSAVAIVPGLNPRLPYPAETGLAAVTVLGHAPNVAVVRPDSPIRSASDFLAQARAKPGRFTYGSAGNGTSTHLAAELLKTTAKVFVIHVPYRGATPAMTDLMGGQIDVAFGTLPSVAPYLANGKLRALAVTSANRSALLPDVPTFAEAGLSGYAAPVWYGIFVAGGTPAPLVQQLYQSIQRAADSEEFRKRIRAEGLTLTLDAPATADALYRADIAKWKKVIQVQSIKAD
ncbi:tripartite tricarboxylate transporter substrate binding protein [Hydrogenophaga sp. SL48]|uniref:tripartite tricarboxylate transporter substrate binding protein n=1 Tax=Hydrogenophaga sp. SL48 TaxID=2806347 RepID=UPI001F41C9F6|nr:tripartite tricarboxylate transporter substrate binding protein [Hydrogenophaga sp. SL48]UJW83269.1 tripartite tricarboxylate transporter substrate binding protein [Hydrogenophaga sp. SL48]